jgi:hypothetical protein
MVGSLSWNLGERDGARYCAAAVKFLRILQVNKELVRGCYE